MFCLGQKFTPFQRRAELKVEGKSVKSDDKQTQVFRLRLNMSILMVKHMHLSGCPVLHQINGFGWGEMEKLPSELIDLVYAYQLFNEGVSINCRDVYKVLELHMGG